MIQSNENLITTKRLCANDIIRALASEPMVQKLIDEENAFNFLQDIASDRSTANSFLFLHKILQNEVYEGSSYWDTDISNKTIERFCQGTRATESDIRHAALKVALALKHFRFIDNATDAYGAIIRAYSRLPKKNLITQKDVNDELLTSGALSALNQQLKPENMHNESALNLLANDNDADLPYLENAKNMDIPFKELRRDYPPHRSFENNQAKLLHCFSIYSYYFFLNHFTYDSKEEAAQFAYSTKDYITRSVLSKAPTAYVKSFHTSLLDEIEQIASEATPQEICYPAVIICECIIDEEAANIGFYFPFTNHSFTERYTR